MVWPGSASMLDRGMNKRQARRAAWPRPPIDDHEHGRQEELQLLGLVRPALAIHGRQVAERLDERALVLPRRECPAEQGTERPVGHAGHGACAGARPARRPRQAAGPRRSSPRCPWPRPPASPPAERPRVLEQKRHAVRRSRPTRSPRASTASRGRAASATRTIVWKLAATARPPPGERQQERARPAPPATSRAPAHPTRSSQRSGLMTLRPSDSNAPMNRGTTSIDQPQEQADRPATGRGSDTRAPPRWPLGPRSSFARTAPGPRAPRAAGPTWPRPRPPRGRAAGSPPFSASSAWAGFRPGSAAIPAPG